MTRFLATKERKDHKESGSFSFFVTFVPFCGNNPPRLHSSSIRAHPRNRRSKNSCKKPAAICDVMGEGRSSEQTKLVASAAGTEKRPSKNEQKI